MSDGATVSKSEQGKIKYTFYLISVLPLLIFLASTERSESDFFIWLDSNAVPTRGRTLGDIGVTLSWIRTAGISTYHDYTVFSIVDTRFDTFGFFNPTGNYRRQFLGVLGYWSPLDGPRNRYKESEFRN